MPLRVLLLEDEAPALERMRALLRETDATLEIAGTADSLRAAAAWLAVNPAPDLLFADIQLSDGLSLELFRAAPPPCPVIFTTAHDDYLLEAFATHGIAYLLKPVKPADLAAALKKYRDLGRHYTASFAALASHLTRPAATVNGAPAASTASATPRRRFLAQKGLAFQPVPVEDVAYFFSEHKLTFLVTHRADRFLLNDSLATLEAELPPTEFFRLSRTLIAHIGSVRSFRSVGKGRLSVELAPAPAEPVEVTQERAAAFRTWAAGA